MEGFDYRDIECFERTGRWPEGAPPAWATMLADTIRVPVGGPEHRAAAAKLRISELEAALASVLPPERGVHGGPLTCLRAVYEDGTDEDTARHRGVVSHGAVAKARAVLAASAGRGR